MVLAIQNVASGLASVKVSLLILTVWLSDCFAVLMLCSALTTAPMRGTGRRWMLWRYIQQPTVQYE